MLARKAIEHPLDITDRGRFARRGFERIFCCKKQFFGVEAGRQTFESHGRDIPVAIATRASEQVELLGCAVDEGTAQFAQQR